MSSIKGRAMWSRIFCPLLRSGSGQGPISPEVNRQHGHQVISGLEVTIRQIENDHTLLLKRQSFSGIEFPSYSVFSSDSVKVR